MILALKRKLLGVISNKKAMSADIAQPGEDISPDVDTETAVALATRLYGVKVDSITQLNGYDDRNYHLQVSEIVENENIKDVCTHGYTLKIMNSSDSKKLDFVEAQCQIMIHMDKHGISTPQPMKTKDGNLFSLENLSSKTEPDSTNLKEHVVRLLTFLPGSLLKDVPGSPELYNDVGSFTANINLILKSFYHKAYDSYSSLWSLKNAPVLKEYLPYVKDKRKVCLVQNVIHNFKEKVLSEYDSLEAGMIHGDLNEQNLLCAQGKGEVEWTVSAVLDWGDSHYTAYVFELAMAMAYMMLQSERVETGGHVVAGYCSLHPLPLHELKLLKICVCTRICQSLVLGLYNHSQHPTNSYVLSTQGAGWKLLENIWETEESELENAWLGNLTLDQHTSI